MTTKIIIAMHKPYKTPEESVYLPLHVGAEGKDMIPGLPAMIQARIYRLRIRCIVS